MENVSPRRNVWSWIRYFLRSRPPWRRFYPRIPRNIYLANPHLSPSLHRYLFPFPPPPLFLLLCTFPLSPLTESINISWNVSPRYHRRRHDVGFIHIYIPCQRQNRYPILLHRPHCYHRDNRSCHWLYPIIVANLERCRTHGEILGWSRSCR